jgi:hypothetical protein
LSAAVHAGCGENVRAVRTRVTARTDRWRRSARAAARRYTQRRTRPAPRRPPRLRFASSRSASRPDARRRRGPAIPAGAYTPAAARADGRGRAMSLYMGPQPSAPAPMAVVALARPVFHRGLLCRFPTRHPRAAPTFGSSRRRASRCGSDSLPPVGPLPSPPTGTSLALGHDGIGRESYGGIR